MVVVIVTGDKRHRWYKPANSKNCTGMQADRIVKLQCTLADKSGKTGSQAYIQSKPQATHLRPNSWTKVIRVFLLVIHGHLCSFTWDFYFFKLTQHLTVFVEEKGGKPDRKPYRPLPYGLRNLYITLKIMPRNLNVIVRSLHRQSDT